jgi:hypothetical protein
MKNFFLILPLAVCALFMYACSNNPTSSKDVPPAPKPATYADTIAVAAKKADFYVRLAFDLADGYLSNSSVVRKRYGKDNKYVESLEFGKADVDGTVYTANIGAPSFKYWHNDEYGVPEVIITSGINNPNLSTKELKRKFYIGQGTGATLPSYQFDVQFRKSDNMAAVPNEQVNLSLTFTQPGVLTAKGATMGIATPFTIYVEDASGIAHPFSITVNNVMGGIKGIEGTISSYTPSAEAEFVIFVGNVVVTGTDTSVNPHRGYSIVLEYSNDAVENKTGNFTSSDSSFTADYTITKDESHYVKTGDSTRKYYVYWDYPL